MKNTEKAVNASKEIYAVDKNLVYCFHIFKLATPIKSFYK